MQAAYERMKPAYRRNAECVLHYAGMQDAACCSMLHDARMQVAAACMQAAAACMLLQPAYARMQAAAGITRMHTIAF